MHKNRRDPKMN